MSNRSRLRATALPRAVRAHAKSTAPSETHYIDEHEFCRRFGIGLSTARRWRQEGSGPKFRRLNGKLVRYSWPDVLEWLDERSPKVASTTQADAAKGKRAS